MPPTECCICLEDTTQYLTCGVEHPVCFKCIQRILKKNNNARCPRVIFYKCPLCRQNVTVDVSAALCIGFGSTQILDNIESLYNIRDPSEVVRQQPVAIPPQNIQPPSQIQPPPNLQPLPNLQPPAQLGAELQLLEHYRRRQEAVRRNQENLIRFRNERRQETDEERLQRQQADEIRRQQVDEERRQADIRTREINEYKKKCIVFKDNTNLSNITNPRFKWIKSLKWKESVVNHFKAWIMYNDNVRYLEHKHNEKSLGGQRLNDLKVEHNYEALKYSTEAPWYCFLFQADILD